VKEFAVIGLGRFGASVARCLTELGHSVLGIDLREDRVHAIVNDVLHAVQADATDEETLRALGLTNFDAVIVAIGGNMEASILVTLMLKELQVRKVIAKASSEAHGKVLEKIGADRVIFPERDMAIRLAHSLVAGDIVDLIEVTPEVSIAEFVAPEKILNRPLRELHLRARFGVTILAIRRQEEVIPAPGGEDIICPGDVVVAIGTNEQLTRLREME